MAINDSPYSNWLEINLGAVERNVQSVLKQTGVDLMAAVKANAYGHGAVACGKAALAGGAKWLAVARYDEANELREAGITAPILNLGIMTPQEYELAIEEDITLVLSGFDVANVISMCANRAGKPARVHMAIETGMGRLGVMPEQAADLAQHLRDLGNVELDGVFSHFANSDVDSHPVTESQLKQFNLALDSLHAAGFEPRWVHHANSGALYALPEARFNLVRGGQAVLGLNPYNYRGMPAEWEPALTAWKAHLVSCKMLPKGSTVGYGSTYTTSGDEIIGVLSVGFGDGIRRVQKLEVLIGGERVPMVGSTCMDVIMVRLPRAYPLYEEVVLIGSQGEASISIEEFAAMNGTVHVDISTLVNKRVPRLYYRT